MSVLCSGNCGLMYVCMYVLHFGFLRCLSVVEGLLLLELGHSPYAGGVYHQPPLLLFALRPLLAGCSPAAQHAILGLLAIFCDVIIALAVRSVTASLYCRHLRASALRVGPFSYPDAVMAL